MKIIYLSIGVCLLMAGCQQQQGNTSNAAFKKNSATVAAYLKSFQDEKVDYSVFADNYWSLNTGFGASSDTITLSQMKEYDAQLLAAFDFKLLGDSIVFLPGVDATTKLPDGSVRYYAEWQLTRPATDSSEQKVAVMKMYESYDFDANGKIAFQQGYGDFTGVMNYLNSK